MTVRSIYVHLFSFTSLKPTLGRKYLTYAYSYMNHTTRFQIENSSCGCSQQSFILKCCNKLTACMHTQMTLQTLRIKHNYTVKLKTRLNLNESTTLQSYDCGHLAHGQSDWTIYNWSCLANNRVSLFLKTNDIKYSQWWRNFDTTGSIKTGFVRTFAE